MESRRFFDLFGPPIAFRREFVPLTGSITAALLLSQMVFWTQQFCGPDGAGNEGWFFLPSQEDVQQQTCLTRHQLEAARGQLIKRGLIDESRKKLAGHESKKNGVVRYRINQDKVFELLGLPKTAILAKSSKLLGMPKTGSSECRKPEVRNAGNRKFLLEREKELKEKEPVPRSPQRGRFSTPYAATTTSQRRTVGRHPYPATLPRRPTSARTERPASQRRNA